MSVWHRIKKEDIALDTENGIDLIEVYVCHDDNGSIYAEIPLDFIKDILSLTSK